MLKKVLGLVFAVFMSVQSYALDEISYAENKIYSVSDSQINDFLKKFIDSSVTNVMMLVEFVTQLLKDAVGNKVLGSTSNIRKIICPH